MRKLILGLALLVAGCYACNNRKKVVENENNFVTEVKSLEPGLSVAEVKAKLGEPLHSSFALTNGIKEEKIRWLSDGCWATITFKNDSLQTITTKEF